MATGITVDFNANLARFTSAIDKATNDLNKFQSNASRVSGNINKIFSNLGVGLSVAAVVAFGKSAIDAADRLNDLSASTGLSLKNLASLSLLAKQSGSDLDGMAGAISKLSKNVGLNEKEFRALGITAKDPLEAFKQLADVFVSIEDPQKRAAVASKALGKSWESAAPTLALGGAEIGRLVEKNNDLTKGLADSAKSADAFNDNMATLKASLFSLASTAIPPLADGLQKIINLFSEVDTKTQTTAENFYLERILKAQEEMDILKTQLANPIATLKFLQPGFEEKATTRIEALRKEIAFSSRAIDDILAKTSKIPAPKPSGAKAVDNFIGGGDKDAEKSAEAERKRLADLKKIQDELVKSNNEYVKSLQDKSLTLGLTEKQSALYELSQKKLNDSQLEAARFAIESTAAQKDQEEITKSWTEAVIEANKEIDEDKTAKANAYADAISRAFPERGEGLQYADDVAAINDQLLLTNITGAEAAAAIEALGTKFGDVKEKSKTFAEDFKDTWADASRSFSDNFGRATADAFLESTKGIDVLRGSVKSFAREMIGAFVSISARRAVDWAIGESLKAKSTASSVAANATIAATAAPAAAAVSLASFGANVPIALAGIAAAFALSKILGQAHDGLENVPRTGTYLLEGGERVVKKADNQRLEKFLNGESAQMGSMNINFNVTGTDAPRAAEIVRSQKNQIIGIIQSAYNERGRRGGPVS